MALPRKLVNALKAGTYEPSAASKRAREAAARINAERRSGGESERIGIGTIAIGPSIEDLRDRAFQAASDAFRGIVSFNDRRFRSNLGKINSRDGLRVLGGLSTDEWMAAASFQVDKNNPTEIPPGLIGVANELGLDPESLVWRDHQGNVHSIFWYH